MHYRWSFGGNRLQIKAEIRLMSDVLAALRANTLMRSKIEGNMQSLEAKELLLHTLLENEQMRLVVWLYPLDHERRHIFSSHTAKTSSEVRVYVLKLYPTSLTCIATIICRQDCLGGTS